MLVGLAWLQLDDVVPTPELEGLPIPALLAVGGALAGLVLAFLSGRLIAVGARRRARAAERAPRRGVS